MQRQAVSRQITLLSPMGEINEAWKGIANKMHERAVDRRAGELVGGPVQVEQVGPLVFGVAHPELPEFRTVATFGVHHVDVGWQIPYQPVILALCVRSFNHR